MPFARFGPSHLAAMLAIAVAAVAATAVARHPGGRPHVRWLLAFVLAVATMAYLVGEGLGGTLTGWDFLPFHLSDFAVFLAIYALVSLRQRAAELLYFLAISALFAIVTPDVDRGFGDWHTVVFFVVHGASVASAVALTFGFGLAPERGAALRALAFVNVYALFAALVNAALGTNFLYLRHKPAQPSLLDWLGDWPWYILSVELLAAALFTCAYLPFGLARDRHQAARILLPLARRLAVACVATADTVKGPAYRSGAPVRSRLCEPTEPGEPLTVEGTVTAAGSCAPLPAALLDVWQTNARGLYSNLLGLARPGDPRGYRLRGRLRPDPEGRYRFVSVLPGHYPLWILTRPRHVHFLVTCPGHRPLVTQLYFAGDPYLRRDPWVKDVLIVALQPDEDVKERRGWRARFDLVLEPEPSGGRQ